MKTETTTIMKRKLGKCQKTGQAHARIWIENNKLSESGFIPNSHYTTEWQHSIELWDEAIKNSINDPPTLRLWLMEDEDIAAEVRKVTDKKGKSVIDLTGWVIKQFFEGYTHYTVEYAKGVITIRGANE